MLKTDRYIHTSELQSTQEKIFIECDSVKGEGLFLVDNQKTNHLLSLTIKNYCKAFSTDKDFFTEETLKKLKTQIASIEKWENKSKRIVLISDEEDKNSSFVFYVTFINGRWYLTVIDFISSDCSV